MTIQQITYLTIEDQGDGSFDTASHDTLAEAVDHAARIYLMTSVTPYGLCLGLKHKAIDLEPMVQEAIAEDQAERRAVSQDHARCHYAA